MFRKSLAISIRCAVRVKFPYLFVAFLFPCRATAFPYIDLGFINSKGLPKYQFPGTTYSQTPAFKKGVGSFKPISSFGFPENYHAGDTFSTDFWLKQAITDRISILLQPTFSTAWSKDKKLRNAPSFTDIPVEFDFRLTKTYIPSLTFNLGMQFPTGNYGNLRKAANSTGSGTYDLRYGFTLLFERNLFNKPIQIRGYLDGRTPLNCANIGVKGKMKRACPRNYGLVGTTLQYPLSHKIILGIDSSSNWRQAEKLNGQNQKWSIDYEMGLSFAYLLTKALSFMVEPTSSIVAYNTKRTFSLKAAVMYSW